MPKISVIMPVYDRTSMLREAIESIKAQTYRDWELVIVTDGSPPPTLAVLKEYEDDSRIRIYYLPGNTGNAVRGRNKAIIESRGEYIAFHDSDDISSPERLEMSLFELQRTAADVCYGGWRVKNEGGIEGPDLEDGREVFSPDMTSELIHECCVPCQGTVMARRQTIIIAGGLRPEMEYMEDWCLWLRMFNGGARFVAIQHVLATIRLHPHNNERKFLWAKDAFKKKVQENYFKPLRFPKKIVYLLPGTGLCGGIAVICQHANRLASMGQDVTLLNTGEDANLSWFPNLIAPVIPWSQYQHHITNITDLVATGWSTADFLNDIPADNKHYFVQSDERKFFPDNKYLQSIINNTYQKQVNYFTEALWLQEWLKTEFNHNASYIPNGIDPTLFFPPTPDNRTNTIDQPIILIEGPIDIPFKGVWEAFKAVQDLNVRIIMVSNAGTPTIAWKPRLNEFHHHINHANMHKLYQRAHILLKLSTVEGSPCPPLEAMACGCIPILLSHPGYRDYCTTSNSIIVQSPLQVPQAIYNITSSQTTFSNFQSAAYQTAINHKWNNPNILNLFQKHA